MMVYPLLKIWEKIFMIKLNLKLIILDIMFIFFNKF